MKLKIFLLSTLIICAASSAMTSTQLFDVVSKELDHAQTKERPSSHSIFGGENNQNLNNQSQGSANKPKNLFDTINFSQVKEKTESKKEYTTNNSNIKANNSLFAAVSKVEKNSNLNAKNYIKVGANSNAPSQTKLNSKPNLSPQVNKRSDNANQKEISDLRNKVNNLVQLNENLMKKFELAEKNKNNKKKINKHIVNFFQKYDKDVSNMKESIQSSQHFVEDKIGKKDEEFKRLFEKTNNHFNQLQTEVHNVHQKVDKIKNDEQQKLNVNKSNLTLNNLKVNKKVNVNGVAFINKLNTNSVDLGNIKIDTNQITIFDKNTKIAVGNEIATVGDLMENMKILNNLISKCGINFENCKPVPEEIFKEQISKQEEILDNLKKLRSETTEVLRNRRLK